MEFSVLDAKTHLSRLLQLADDRRRSGGVSERAQVKLSGRASDWIRAHRRELGLEWLPIYGEHILLLDSFPWVHKDPFDRILVCQSILEDVTLLTPDQDIRRYDTKTIW